MRFAIVLCVLFGVGDVHAQQVAGAPTARHVPREPHPPSGLGGGLSFGWAGLRDGATGYVARLEYELFPILSPSGIPGGVVGFHVGWEFWRTKPDWGLGLPFLIVLGVRTQPLRATIGVGLNVMFIDVVDDDTGFGLYAPMAAARVGGDIMGFQLGADARIVRRWQIGAPDHTQWQLGVFVARTWESKRPMSPVR